MKIRVPFGCPRSRAVRDLGLLTLINNQTSKRKICEQASATGTEGAWSECREAGCPRSRDVRDLGFSIISHRSSGGFDTRKAVLPPCANWGAECRVRDWKWYEPLFSGDSLSQAHIHLVRRWILDPDVKNPRSRTPRDLGHPNYLN